MGRTSYGEIDLRASRKRTLTAAILIFTLMPATILVSTLCLGGARYMITSLLIIRLGVHLPVIGLLHRLLIALLGLIRLPVLLLIRLLLGMRLLLVGFHRLEGLGISRHPLLRLLDVSLLRIRILLHRILPRICLIALLAPGGRISVGRLTVIHPCSDPFRILWYVIIG